MKITREYEVGDIDLKDEANTPYVLMTTMALIGAMARDTDPPKEVDPTFRVRSAIALVRTTMENAGYVISKREDVPAVFREGKPDGA